MSRVLAREGATGPSPPGPLSRAAPGRPPRTGEGEPSPGPSPTRTHAHPGEGKCKAREQDGHGLARTGMDDEPPAAWASACGEVWLCPLGRVLPLPEQSCEDGTDSEGARAELRGPAWRWGLQLPAWSSTGEWRGTGAALRPAAIGRPPEETTPIPGAPISGHPISA